MEFFTIILQFISGLNVAQSIIAYSVILFIITGAFKLLKHVFKHKDTKFSFGDFSIEGKNKAENLLVPVEPAGKDKIIQEEHDRTTEKRRILYDKLITMYRNIRGEFKDFLLEKGVSDKIYTETLDFTQFDFISREILFMTNGHPCLLERVFIASETDYRTDKDFIINAVIDNILEHFFWTLEEKISKSYNEDIVESEESRIIETIISCNDILEFYKMQSPLIRNTLRECFIDCIELDKKYHRKKGVK